TWADYAGDRTIGSVQRTGRGVIFFTPEDVARFSFPGAGEIGSAGRNTFRGPRYFNTDLSIVKRFRVREGHSVVFRAEMYNLFNNVNFGLAAAAMNLSTPQSFGRSSQTVGNARIMQAALRYDF
ncbi:MAG: TonB-dependent receptor, partial [Bryobacteraceae bacterium]